MPHPRVAQRLPLAQLAVVLIAQVGCTSGSSGLSPLEVDLPDDSVVVAPGSTIHIADGASCPSLTWSEPMARCFAAYEHERGGDTTLDSAWPSRDPFALCPDLREITDGSRGLP